MMKHLMYSNRWTWALLTLSLAWQMTMTVQAAEAERPKPLKAGYHEIKSAKAIALLKQHQGLIILDIRTEKEYLAGHIIKAKHVDYYKNDFKAQLGKLNRKKPYLVHCASGGRSGKAMRLFKDLGFTRIYHMNDGFKGWEKAGLPVRRGREKASKKDK